jgi:hypothetical protein
MGQKRAKIVGFAKCGLQSSFCLFLLGALYGLGTGAMMTRSVCLRTQSTIVIMAEHQRFVASRVSQYIFCSCAFHDSSFTTVASRRIYSHSRLSCRVQGSHTEYAGFNDTFFLRLRYDLLERSR